MAKVQTRRSVSVNGALGRRLHAYADGQGISVAQLVEAILEPVLAGTEQIPIAVPQRKEHVKARARTRWRETREGKAERDERSDADRATYMRIALAAAVAAPPPFGPKTMTISADLYESLESLAERELAAGRSGDVGELLDRAICRMLDVIERLPPSNMCGCCTNQITGDARLLPQGKNDALVWICRTCDTEHPRLGRYAYNGPGALTRGEYGVGPGNKHPGKR